MRLRPLQIGLLLSLAIVLTTIFTLMPRPSVASSPVGDFAPTRSVQEAAVRVAAAQAAEADYRLNRAPQQPLAPSTRVPSAQTIYFPQTGHHVSNRTGFLDVWRSKGQILIFGYPLTEEFVENGRIVQYFERARFEFNAERIGQPDQVLLGLVGSELTAGRTDVPFQRLAAPLAGASFFPETGHSLSGEFRGYWEKRGGIMTFGFPISEPFAEDGNLVQYFERGHFAYHPEEMGQFYRSMESSNGISLNTLHEIELGDLGRRLATARGIDISPVARLADVADWDPALWERRIIVDLSRQWLTAYEGGLVVYRAPVATGRDGFNTPVGTYAIYDKLPMQSMSGSAGGETWYVPNIPWVMYVVGGVAIHGTYWHNAFGTGFRLSHGCINVGMDDAEWLYGWADVGTVVQVRE